MVETVTDQIILQPAEILADGTIAQPAIYKTETRQQIVKPREDTWFETPCEEEITPDFTASLQRALKARGHYRGPINGMFDSRTRTAIRAYQKPQGLDSDMISLAAARQMGLSLARSPDIEREIAPSPLELAAVEAQKTLEEEREQELAAAREEAERIEAERAANAARQEAARLAEAEAERKKAEQEAAARQAALEAEQARKEAERQATIQAERAKRAKRQAELEAALEAERLRRTPKRKPLPISTETAY